MTSLRTRSTWTDVPRRIRPGRPPVPPRCRRRSHRARSHRVRDRRASTRRTGPRAGGARSGAQRGPGQGRRHPARGPDHAPSSRHLALGLGPGRPRPAARRLGRRPAGRRARLAEPVAGRRGDRPLARDRRRRHRRPLHAGVVRRRRPGRRGRLDGLGHPGAAARPDPASRRLNEEFVDGTVTRVRVLGPVGADLAQGPPHRRRPRPPRHLRLKHRPRGPAPSRALATVAASAQPAPPRHRCDIAPRVAKRCDELPRSRRSRRRRRPALAPASR